MPGIPRRRAPRARHRPAAPSRRAGYDTRAYLWKQYSELFLSLIPAVCEQYAPGTSYVHSSPSLRKPGGALAFADYFSGGDTHYYLPDDGNAPYQISARDEGNRVDLWVSNERREPFTGNVEWHLADADGSQLRGGRRVVTAAAGQSLACVNLDFTDLLTASNRDRVSLGFRLLAEETEISAGTVLFALPKDFHFERPRIEADVQDRGDRYEIQVTTACFAKSVVLDTQAGDCVFSDNWIDLTAGRPRSVTVLKADAAGLESADALRKNLTVRSLNDIMIDAAASGEAGSSG